MSEKTIIEINGVKLEVDLRYARRVENIRVGSRVKVLKREYGDTHKVLHGIVIGFEPFQKLPTIIIAAARIEYQEAKIEFVYYNADTKDLEVVVAVDDDLAAIDKNSFVQEVDRQVAKHEAEIKELQDRRAYFLSKFAAYWEPLEQAVADATAENQDAP